MMRVCFVILGLIPASVTGFLKSPLVSILTWCSIPGTLHRGAIDELEHTLSPTRHEPPPSEERMRDLAESHLYIATEEARE